MPPPPPPPSCLCRWGGGGGRWGEGGGGGGNSGVYNYSTKRENNGEEGKLNVPPLCSKVCITTILKDFLNK